ncbi:alcohol oxidase [Thozetella sp. PMI_491]|nr:alcohol oxidase [Thozetella sp. PMI_491]
MKPLLLSLFTFLVGAAPRSTVRRQVSQLRESYDFIIAGAGTAGLTIADRLSEAFTNKTVLVIEYGVIEETPGTFDPPQRIFGATGGLASSFRFNSLPIADFGNKTALVLAGKVVGGSSAVNGMFFDRGSRFDYDAWAQVGSPEFNSHDERWDWDGLFPNSTVKSVTFTEPSATSVHKYGYTWDERAFGGSTPIFSSYPPFLWGDHLVVRDAWREMGILERKECAGGYKDGLCWIPISEHPVTSKRSHSGVGHYAVVNATRKNYDLFVKHQVIRVVYPNGLASGPPLVEVRSLDDGRVFNVSSKGEVIISAGALHTPTILQRSGIGPASFLRTANIPVILDLPGVGSNFQDHGGPGITWNYTEPGNFSPLPSDMLTDTFAAEAVEQFNQRPAQGPYTLAMSNTGIFIPLANMTNKYEEVIKSIRTMVIDGSAASYLPADYRSDPTMVAGYKHQLATIADLLENKEAPSLESAFTTGGSVRAVLLHPLSRGTVRLNLSDPLEQPILDYRTASNPIDSDINLVHTKYLRGMIDTPTMQSYGAYEITPGASVQSDEDLRQFIKDDMIFSYMHPCCTAAMIPREKGGVVGPDLRVHGANGLRVVDISILPLLPSSHLSATAYAVGEKAAEIIIQHWAKRMV